MRVLWEGLSEMVGFDWKLILPIILFIFFGKQFMKLNLYFQFVNYNTIYVWLSKFLT